MAEFKIIETQEEMDRIVETRLAREREKYADYEQLKEQNTSLTQQLADAKQSLSVSEEEKKGFNTQLEELKGKVKSYELSNLKTTVAIKNGLPYDLASRLVGDDEEALTADALNLAKMMEKKEVVAPLKQTEPKGDEKSGAYRELLTTLNIEGE